LPIQQESVDAEAGARRTLIGIAAFILLLLGLYVASLTAPRTLSRDEYMTLGYYPLAQTKEISTFSLIDQDEQQFGPERFQGHWSLLFFGYTYCPDVCPVTLVQINKAVQKLDPDIETHLEVALVSVDPERDTPEVLGKYVRVFNDSFTGVTGELDEVVKLATQLNIAFGKAPGDEPGTYQVDHSGSIVVINPEGRYHGFLKPPHQVEKMASVMAALVESW
jgi:protein SCO1/2